ncbi:MAG: hypothetical protein P8182_09320 [Deltaproteobacteria bacterium]
MVETKLLRGTLSGDTGELKNLLEGRTRTIGGKRLSDRSEHPGENAAWFRGVDRGESWR